VIASVGRLSSCDWVEAGDEVTVAMILLLSLSNRCSARRGPASTLARAAANRTSVDNEHYRNNECSVN